MNALIAVLLALPQQPKEPYTLGPDSQRQEGVPRGKVTHHTWKSETVFPGTIREYWVYVPAQHDGTSPAAVMVFQDGHAYVDEKGQFRVPVVFDNLIHKKEMPSRSGSSSTRATRATPCRSPAGAGRATEASSTTRCRTPTPAS